MYKSCISQSEKVKIEYDLFPNCQAVFTLGTPEKRDLCELKKTL